MSPQITVNIGVPGWERSGSATAGTERDRTTSAAASSEGELPAPMLEPGRTGAREEASLTSTAGEELPAPGDGAGAATASPGAEAVAGTILPNELPSPMQSDGRSGGGIMQNNVTTGSSGHVDLPSPLQGAGTGGGPAGGAMAGASGEGELPSPLQGVGAEGASDRGAMAGSFDGELPSPLQGAEGELPGPEQEGQRAGAGGGSAELPKPSERGHRGEHVAGQSGDLPAPQPIDALQAQASRASQRSFAPEGHGPQPEAPTAQSGEKRIESARGIGENGPEADRGGPRRGRKAT